MDDLALQSVKRLYRFDQWANRSRLKDSLFVIGYFVPGNAVPGWMLHRSVPIDVRGAPPCVQSILKRPDSAEALLRLDHYECSSRSEAHELLVRMLGQVEASRAGSPRDESLGDVAFSWFGDEALALVRGNVTIFLANAGRDRVPLTEIARNIDAALAAKPRQTRAAQLSRVQLRIEVAGRTLKSGASWPLKIEMPELADETYYCKFFSSSGEIIREQERLTYTAGNPGRARITMYAVAAEGIVGSTVQQFTIE